MHAGVAAIWLRNGEVAAPMFVVLKCTKGEGRERERERGRMRKKRERKEKERNARMNRKNGE